MGKLAKKGFLVVWLNYIVTFRIFLRSATGSADRKRMFACATEISCTDIFTNHLKINTGRKLVY